MIRKTEEAEVIVRIDYQDDLAYITVSDWPAMAAKMTRLYGTPFDDSVQTKRWKVSLKAISFRKLEHQFQAPRPKKTLTPEHLAALQAGRRSKTAEITA